MSLIADKIKVGTDIVPQAKTYANPDYKLTQNDNNGWNTYDAIIVTAENETIAKSMAPNITFENFIEYNFSNDGYTWKDSWANHPDNVKIEYIGESFR